MVPPTRTKEPALPGLDMPTRAVHADETADRGNKRSRLQTAGPRRISAVQAIVLQELQKNGMFCLTERHS